VSNLTDRLLTYALGRGTEYYDAPVVREIIRSAAAHDYRWSSIILAVVRSRPFQMRMAAPAAPDSDKRVAARSDESSSTARRVQ
jgi:hypothetical protein